jgi:hypothetical protein
MILVFPSQAQPTITAVAMGSCMASISSWGISVGICQPDSFMLVRSRNPVPEFRECRVYLQAMPPPPGLPPKVTGKFPSQPLRREIQSDDWSNECRFVPRFFTIFL